MTGLVPVSVSAADNVGVSKVELRVNGVLVGTDIGAPYALSWDSTKVANGMSTLMATAYDASGNVANSASVAVNVSNAMIVDTTPPTVSISNPVNGSKVNGNVSISVTASDNSGAEGITQTLVINGKTVATSAGSFLSFNWNTRKLVAGTYTVQAFAKDIAGNSTIQLVQVSK